ncbi:PhzF family phenazine biosynthesis protein [Geomicrobium sediminis]|uniref:PhzF family phenazine biosynthesis protein n=1 Tax=Geomicrobium sediminis TaxID=1347788 RepID=A0ABS2PBX5_9BACL|nr:PhzF family phenazine biosynthesis isomerase [Geomicrobium sediminis]MBM7632787.1 PhzF family phenazine biosynthesis protein [Geomicrobium sediminis]
MEQGIKRVFSKGEHGGNPCRVVLDTEQWTELEKQTFASHCDEDVVYVERAETGSYAFRFFTKKVEKAFCLHATIAATTSLVEHSRIAGEHALIETKAGAMAVTWNQNKEVQVEQNSLSTQEKVPTIQDICESLMITKVDLRDDLPIQIGSTSRSKLIIPLKNNEVLQALNPDFDRLWDLCEAYETTGFYPFVIESNGEVHARQFPSRGMFKEDAATGVAASALSAYLIDKGTESCQEGWHLFQVHQGEAMGRPSVMKAEAYVHLGKVTKTRITGSAVNSEQ